MKKKVSELSNEEFKKTFPIILSEHNSNYKDWYEIEKRNILSTVDNKDVVRINHIGSSAVEGLIAKPIIDMLLEIDGCCNVTKLLDDLKMIGFGEEISTRRDDPMRLLLGKGFSADGFSEKVYLLHVRYFGNWDELYFRDFLIEHPDVAAEYGKLKQKILSDIENGIIERMPNGAPNGYSEAKLAFVKKYSNVAKQQFQNRYKPCSYHSASKLSK
ncbi:MAG TPA: GrpB family protein [Caproiciproducens sp.]|nr:GrpB family protein [Caproiciproducens sp.]